MKREEKKEKKEESTKRTLRIDSVYGQDGVNKKKTKREEKDPFKYLNEEDDRYDRRENDRDYDG